MKSYLSFFLLIISLGSLAQENKIKAYLDCRCDENYIKQETSFLEYVRDQDLADVEIFIRDERNPTGSRSFEIKIDGNKKYIPNLILENEVFLRLLLVIEIKIINIGNAQKPYDS